MKILKVKFAVDENQPLMALKEFHLFLRWRLLNLENFHPFISPPSVFIYLLLDLFHFASHIKPCLRVGTEVTTYFMLLQKGEQKKKLQTIFEGLEHFEK